jgi:hypothetical protein
MMQPLEAPALSRPGDDGRLDGATLGKARRSDGVPRAHARVAAGGGALAAGAAGRGAGRRGAGGSAAAGTAAASSRGGGSSASGAALGRANDRHLALGKGALDLLACDSSGPGEGVGLDAGEGCAQDLLIAQAICELAAAGKQGVGLALRCGLWDLGWGSWRVEG